MKIRIISAVVMLAPLCGSATPEAASQPKAAPAAKAAPPSEDQGIFESSTPPVATGQLDKIVFAKLSALGIQPVLCSDAVFVRRAYLDVIGTLPTAAEAREFIEHQDTGNKRRILVDYLLERNEFADYWAMKWGDVLRIKAEFPVNLWPNATQAYHRWVRTSIVENKPYDQFAREMLTSSGSNFRVGPVNFYRALQNKTPEDIASTVALTLMGARAEAWPKEYLPGMAVFFSQVGYKPSSEWKEEIVFWDPLNGDGVAGNSAPGQAAIDTLEVPPDDLSLASANNTPHAAIFPDGSRVQLPANRDPRDIFADWLITPENPWFTCSIVNRVWAWLLGRGITDAPDDIRKDNPPSNPELQAYLEKELIASGYDLKHLYRLILSSSTYQFSSVPRFKDPRAAANFASYPLRRLDAEVLIDAINAAAGSSDLYTSAIPEPFTYIPRDTPAISVADGSITSPFLALFGRSQRATGMAGERDNKIVAAQWLHMLNSGHIQAKLEKSPKLKELLTAKRPPSEILDELYLTILSRFPTDEEKKNAGAYAQSLAAGASSPKKGWNDRVDVAWSLFNSTEFLYRH
ncbi:MAG: DUF1553 domain-containing protein [Verrucomicrobiales bacterium]